MEVTQMQTNGVEIVAISGHIVGSENASRAFHELFQSLIGDGKKKFLVDLEETPWTNSLGIGMLMGAYASVKRNGGEVVLANPTERIRDLLAVTKLTLVFKVFDSRQAAIEHLTKV